MGKVNHATGGRLARYETTLKPTGGFFDNPEISAERTGGTWAAKYGKKCSHWDVAPPQEYFSELFRVSKNQIIWGGNYFSLSPSRCFLSWDKIQEFSGATEWASEIEPFPIAVTEHHFNA